MSSSREGMKARSGIHARLRARHRKQEAVDEKRHQCMKLNIQTASDHAVLELSFHRHFPRARRLKLRQRLEFSTRFPSHTHDNTTTRTAHTHERTQSLNFRRTAWRQPRLLQCLLDPFLSCRLTRRPLRSLNCCPACRVAFDSYCILAMPASWSWAL